MSFGIDVIVSYYLSILLRDVTSYDSRYKTQTPNGGMLHYHRCILNKNAFLSLFFSLSPQLPQRQNHGI